jgi:hypothetical protein
MNTQPGDTSEEQRRAERSTWPVRMGRLGEPQMDEDWPRTTAEERLAMVWPMTVQAWAIQGLDVADLRVPRHLMYLTPRAVKLSE